jgi:hypothetical protein
VSSGFLFSKERASELYQAQLSAASKAIAAIDEDVLLSTPTEDISREIQAQFGLEHPVLLRETISQEKPFDEVVNLGPEYVFSDVRRKVKVRPFKIGFTGHARLFNAQPSQFSNPPEGSVDQRTMTLTLFVRDLPGSSPDPVAIRESLDTQLANVERWLDWGRRDTESLNSSLGKTTAIDARRFAILAERDLQAAIGIPLVRQKVQAAPTLKRRIATSLSGKPGAPFEPEPAITDQDYEAALKTLETARLQLERTPSVAKGLDEEGIRDLLLLHLNGVFEGVAGGEMFNLKGKTDILVRVRDRNIFIGECKIWHGEKQFSEAIDQLTGYLSWRDVKAALLLFVRGGDISGITEKAIHAIETHRRYKRTVKLGGAGERSDFVLHADGDERQEIKLAFMPFALAK